MCTAPPQDLAAFRKLRAELPLAGLQNFLGIYAGAVHELRGLLTTQAPYVRPTTSRVAQPFVQTKLPEIRRDKFEPGHILSKEEFAQRAVDRVFPLEEADVEAAAELPEDLILAIERVALRGKHVIDDRRVRMDVLRGIAARLEPLRAVIDACKSKEATEISAPFNVAWTAAIVDALQWPDTDLPVRYVKGFNVVFDIPDSGVFRADPQPAEISRDAFMAANAQTVTRLTREIETTAKRTDDESVTRRRACWQRTKEEIAERLIRKPRSRAQMDRKHKRGKWRCIGRSAIMQKGKWRCIDNGKRSKHNKATTMHERLTCGRADFPVMVAREFAKRRRKVPRMQHGTNDLRAAYRRVPTRQPQFTCVAVWDDDKKKVVYIEVPGHNFGLKSAVVNFNRFPELATVAARRLLWCVTEHYYDDNDTCEPSFASDSGQLAMVELCSDTFFGFSFDPGKDVAMEECNEYLGVLSDLSRAREGILAMTVSSKRRKKIKALVEQVLQEQKLRSGMAASIFGKARFMLSPCFGNLGKACLQPIMTREYQRGQSDLSDDLRESVEFIEYACDAMPAMQLQLLASSKGKVVIFSDAEGKMRNGNELPSGHLGAVVYHPDHGTHYCHARAPDSWVALFDAIKRRDQYIGQYELAAALAAIISVPAEWLRDRPVELWIDNSGAAASLVSGYSGVPDCAKIVNLFHFTAARIGISALFIDYVPSESNPADVPSRLHEMSEAEAVDALAAFGSIRDMRLPALANEAGEWLPLVDIARSVWSPGDDVA